MQLFECFITFVGSGLKPRATLLQYVDRSQMGTGLHASHLGDSYVFLVRVTYSWVWAVFAVTVSEVGLAHTMITDG